MKKKSKCSFWVKQLRRPLCFLIALCIVIFWGFSTYAATLTFSNYEDFYTFTGIDASLSYPAITYSNVQTFALNDGYNGFSNVSGGIFNYTPSGVNASQYQEWQRQMFSASGRTFPKSLNVDGLDFDISSCYWLITSPSSGTSQIMLFWGSGQIAMVDYYVVSESPFYLTRNSRSLTSGYWDFNGVPTYVYVSTASDNGLYCYDIRSSWYYCGTNMSIYASSSDGNSGFTNFSLTSTDFDFSEENYDFNFYKTGFGVIAGSDPEPVPSDMTGQHYNYGSISHKVFGSPFDSLYYGSTIGINSYMRDNNNRYWLFTDAKIGIKFVGDNEVSEYTQNDSVSLSSFVRNNSSTYSVLLDPGLMYGPGGTLSAKLRSGYQTIAGSSFGYSDGSWSDGSFVFPDDSGFGLYYEYNYKPLKNSFVGSDGIQVCYLDLTSWFSYDGTFDDITNVDSSSGMYHVRFNLLDGTYNVLQNDVVQNLDPIEGEGNLPITSPSSGGGSYGSGGGVSVVQGGISNNLNAIIEYLFQLDASGMQNVSQNVGSTIQYVVSNIGDTSNTTNGFWDVLKKGYSVIPDDIWNWIKLSVATLLSGAVITWVYNGVRVKRG